MQERKWIWKSKTNKFLERIYRGYRKEAHKLNWGHCKPAQKWKKKKKNLESSKKSENKSTLDQTCQNGPPLPQPTEGSLLHKCQRDNPVTNFFIFLN